MGRYRCAWGGLGEPGSRNCGTTHTLRKGSGLRDDLGLGFRALIFEFGMALLLKDHEALSSDVFLQVPGDLYTSSIDEVQRTWLLDCNSDCEDGKFGT